jgi:hypothetical protein
MSLGFSIALPSSSLRRYRFCRTLTEFGVSISSMAREYVVARA